MSRDFGGYNYPLFRVGQRVRVARILPGDTITTPALVGFEGVIEEVEYVGGGQYNYWVDGHYLNEQMLEAVNSRRNL